MAQTVVGGKHAGDSCTVQFQKNWNAPFWYVSIPDPLPEAAQPEGVRVVVELLDNYGNLQASVGWVCGWSERLAVIVGTDDWTAKTTQEWRDAVEKWRNEGLPGGDS
jgi:hypothetical protein